MKTKGYWMILLTLLWMGACQSETQQQQSEKLEANTEISAPDFSSKFTIKHINLPSGNELAYVDEGTGSTTLLMIHGLGGNLKHWETNIKSLKENFRCIAIDLPGYGNSPFVESEANAVTFYADLINELKQELGLENTVIIGHSMGGQVAIHSVLNAPENFQKMVLVSPAGLETFSSVEAMGIKSFATAAYYQQQGEKDIKTAFALNFHQQPEVAESWIAERIAMKEEEGFDAYCKTVERGVTGMLEAPVAERLAELKVPVLVTFGQDDKLIPNRILHKDMTVQQVAEKASAIPNHQIELIPEVGHMPHVEKPQVFEELLKHFLESAEI
ncbi:alpha/beta hydrolase [Limibacter armeniacum]|uniref:alpha/beta fold hydrolase n=1 Tax=Limibacter armeniacum TaxID=466084 RepID=UPI002FE533DC